MSAPRRKVHPKGSEGRYLVTSLFPSVCLGLCQESERPTSCAPSTACTLVWHPKLSSGDSTVADIKRSPMWRLLWIRHIFIQLISAHLSPLSSLLVPYMHVFPKGSLTLLSGNGHLYAKHSSTCAPHGNQEERKNILLVAYARSEETKTTCKNDITQKQLEKLQSTWLTKVPAP